MTREAAGAAAPPRLSLRGVSRRFGNLAALDGVSLDVAAGEFLALLGGSGSGKSTLLRVVAGFEAPDSGTVTLDGADLLGVPPHRRPVNMMFQSYALFPHMTVAANIAYGLKREGRPRAEIAARLEQAVAMLRLEGMESRRPHALSGGQRQRVALARALVKRPRLLLLDEPLGALDANLRERTGFELRAIQRESGAAFVMVTHDQAEALALADRIAVMDRGRLIQVAPPREIYDRPATRFVAEFLGAANVLTGTRSGDGALESPDAGCTLRATAALPPGVTAVALRPERIRIGPALGDNTASGTVEEAAFRGESSLILVRLAGGALLRVSHAEEDGAPPPRGSAVRVSWDADSVVPLQG